MTNIQSTSLIPFCSFIDKSVIHVSIFYMHAVHQLLIHFLYIDGWHTRTEAGCHGNVPLGSDRPTSSPTAAVVCEGQRSCSRGPQSPSSVSSGCR